MAKLRKVEIAFNKWLPKKKMWGEPGLLTYSKGVMLQFAEDFGLQEARKDRDEVEKLSKDGVFFFCSGCKFEPDMGSDKDDLISMNYCPSCGGKFKTKK